MPKRNRGESLPVPDDRELLSDMEESSMGEDYGEDEEDFDGDLADLNDPRVQNLSEPPLLGGRPHSHAMYGEEATTIGRASSPKLWASASQFPTAVQFRVWRMENGVAVGLGVIAVDASEEDFVRAFITAMPEPGDGRIQYALRPLNLHGKEIGKEIVLNISEHHATLRHLREKRKQEESAAAGGGWGRGGDVIVQGGGGGDTGAYMAEEMGRMFEHSVEMAETQTKQLQAQLERERAELRDQERMRAEERVRAAENASSVTERMTEKLLMTDKQRSTEALSAQKETSQLVMTTLTTTFAQQQEAARMQAERDRQMDAQRQEQERAFHERREKEMEALRARERDEAERRRREEREEHDRKMERERLDAERKERERKEEFETKREQMRMEIEERRREDDRRRDADRADWERKQAAEKDDRERKERIERERFDREKLEMLNRQEQDRLRFEQAREDARREDMRREQERREEMERREQQRQSESALLQKQLEMQAQRDREHAERMMEMARQEREAQREAQASRERAERESREAADAERQRRHELQLREMEIQKDRDREHAERMVQLSKLDAGGSGLGGITEMLGMDTGEVLSRIFGGNSNDEEGGWSAAMPKVLGGLGEMAKVMMSARTPPIVEQPKRVKAQPERHGRRPTGTDQKMVAVQTPDGVKMITADQLHELQQHQLQQMQQGQGRPVRTGPHRIDPATIELSDAPFRPPGMAAGDKDEMSTHEQDEGMAPPSEAAVKLQAGSEVDTIRRAKEAGLPLVKQRKVRKAIRALADKLAVSAKDDWMGLVSEALTSNIDIYHYLRAVTVYAALAEAKLSAELAGQIVEALQESGVITSDVLPFDEQDFVRLAAEAAMDLGEDLGEEAVNEIAASIDSDSDEGEDA